MGKKRRQHYLPVMYLKGFCDLNNIIWTYDKCDVDVCRSASPERTAFENKLYDVEDIKEEADINVIENFLAEKIEGPAGEALNKLRDEYFPQNNEREALCLFFALLIVRTPVYLDFLEQQHNRGLNQFLESCAREHDYFHQGYKNAGINATYEQVEADRLSILEEKEITIKLHKNLKLHSMLILGFHIAKWLSIMKWALIKTNEDFPFLIGDNLFNFNNPNLPNNNLYRAGFAFPDSCLFIPISSSLTLMMVNRDNFREGQIFKIHEKRYDSQGNKVDIKNIIKALNNQTALNAARFIFYNKNCNKLKRLLKKFFINRCLP